MRWTSCTHEVMYGQDPQIMHLIRFEAAVHGVPIGGVTKPFTS